MNPIKLTLLTVCVAATLPAWLPPVRGVMILVPPTQQRVFSEDFRYPAGELTGADGGAGFTQPWTDVDTTVTEVVAPGLSYSDANHMLPDFGRALQGRTDSGPSAASRNFRPVSAADPLERTLFFSALLNIPNGYLGNNDNAFVWLGRKGSGGAAANTFLRMGIFGRDAAGANEFGIELSPGGSGAAFSPVVRANGPIDLSTTYLLVARIRSSDGLEYDTVDFWATPGSGPLSYSDTDYLTGPGEVTVTEFNSNFSSLGRVGVSFQNLDIGDYGSDLAQIDRLYLGAYPDIVPETSARLGILALLGLTGASCIRNRSCRRLVRSSP